MLTISTTPPTVHKSHTTIIPFEWFFDRLAFFWIVIRENYFNYDPITAQLFPELEDPDFVAYLAQQYELLHGSP